MNKEIPLQHNMFTGVLVDNRTRTQKKADREREEPKQTEMFRQRDIAQFGVTANPQMSLSPHTKLVLLSEDPRTEEEKERDRQREAEALTEKLFSGHDELYSKPTATQDNSQETAEEDEPEATTEVQTKQPISKQEAYQQLVQVTKEKATTVWIAEAYRGRFQAQLPKAILEAHQAGLTVTEITAATQVGNALGKQGQQEIKANGAHTPSGVNGEKRVVIPIYIADPKPAPRPTIVGYRAQARAERVHVRKRSLSAIAGLTASDAA